MEITDDQKASINAAYVMMYDQLNTWKRKRKESEKIKEIAINHWKKRLLDFQSVITDVLKIDATFKDL